MFKTGPRCCIVRPGFRTASLQEAHPLASLILRVQRGRRGLLQIQTTPRRSCKTPCTRDNKFVSVARGRLQEGMHSSPWSWRGEPQETGIWGDQGFPGERRPGRGSRCAGRELGVGRCGETREGRGRRDAASVEESHREQGGDQAVPGSGPSSGPCPQTRGQQMLHSCCQRSVPCAKLIALVR